MRKLWHDLLPALVILVSLMGARSSIADHYVVPTGSMEFSVMPGDRLLVDKTAYGFRLPFSTLSIVEGDLPSRGDVVVFDSPEDGTRLVKRVVAVGGDVVTVRDGLVDINGESTSGRESGETVERHGRHTAHLNLTRGGGPDFGPFVVPTGEVLVMGDARGNSRDGRTFGTVPASAIYGRAVAVFYRDGEGFIWDPL